MTPIRVGQGVDVHQWIEGRPLKLGGIKIPHRQGLLGHSDADVLLHALCDALLGAAGLGDIGHHFPDNDPTYAGIDSCELLQKVRQAIQKTGWLPGNIDTTIICEHPKLAPFIPAMRQRIAILLQIPEEHINIKATTTERLGFAGREEGVIALAVCLLYRTASE